jgi:hypothetical protein
LQRGTATGNNQYKLNISLACQIDDLPKKFEEMAKYEKQTDRLQNGVKIVPLDMRGPDG